MQDEKQGVEHVCRPGTAAEGIGTQGVIPNVRLEVVERKGRRETESQPETE